MSNRPPDSESSHERTPLLSGGVRESSAHDGPCHHGSFSPQAESPLSRGTSNDYFSPSDSENRSAYPQRRLLHGSSSLSQEVRAYSDSDSTSDTYVPSRVGRRGVESPPPPVSDFRASPAMYLSYYVPSVTWIRNYRWSYLSGDFVAALTLASCYLPMALSLAENVAHIPPINGLYTYAFNPLVYALLGSSVHMIVGPEAAGSLLIGTMVRHVLGPEGDRNEDDRETAMLEAKITGIVTGVAGAIVLFAGLIRVGFLDSILSRPFLRGFVSAIGIVIGIDQLIPELGLNELARESGASHGTPAAKLYFVLTHVRETHLLTFQIAFTSFVTMMIFRKLKAKLQPKYPAVHYFPDRFLIVVLFVIASGRGRWDEEGVDILGSIKAASGHTFSFQWPFRASNMNIIREGMSSAFLIALLGFFESSVAAKGLGSSQAFPRIQLSANRELVALGMANVVSACFSSLPGFGGYGRSKLNKATGAHSPMSSVFLSLLTVICIRYLLPSLYYLPKPVLSSFITLVAWTLVEEAPHDISFFLSIRGWNELLLMALICLATLFVSLSFGIAVGIGVSLMQVIRHATRPRIQILGRIPGTQRFENAEAHPENNLEFVEGCLIVKIPEPLTFANTGDLKARLRRLEMYGAMAHPALPRMRAESSNRNVIFDIHGVTSLDGSGVQVFREIIEGYRDRGVRVIFSRAPSNPADEVWLRLERSGIVDMIGGRRHFVNDIHDALKLTEYEETVGDQS